MQAEGSATKSKCGKVWEAVARAARVPKEYGQVVRKKYMKDVVPLLDRSKLPHDSEDEEED